MSKEKKMIKFIFEQHSRMSCIFRYNSAPRLVRQSVAEHSYNVPFFAMLISDYLQDQGVVVDKLATLEMGMIHDIEEIKSGDILHTMKHGKFKEELRKLNEQNISSILVRPFETNGTRYYYLWKEAQEKETLEAKIVAFCDILDRIVYEVKEGQLGNSYFRKMLVGEAEELVKLVDVLPQLQEFIYELVSYITTYLECWK